MDIVLLLKAAVMGVVEGVTEFLPISSTGHLILTAQLLGLHDERGKVFEVAIQTGAIVAVILVYWQRVRSAALGLLSGDRGAQRLSANVLIGFAPAVVLGLLFGGWIKAHLFNPLVVAATFIVGGVIILWAEARAKHTKVGETIAQMEDMRWSDALKVGLVQCLAMVPGTSRSGATIIGGMLLGLSRRAATDFSFFLAIPTLMGAGVYDLYKHRALLSVDYLPSFAVGLIFSFLSAWVCVRWLIAYISQHSFTPFAWYRMAFGVFILLSWHFAWVDWT